MTAVDWNGMHAAWSSAETMPWVCGTALAGLGATAWRMRRQLKLEGEERWRERRMREELEAYARVDPAVAPAVAAGVPAMEAAKAMAKRVCRVIGEKSAYGKAAMLLRDAEGTLYCAGRVGVDDLTVKALDAWGRKVVEEERGGGLKLGQREMMVPGSKASFAIALGEWKSFDREVGGRALEGKKERRRWRRALVAPVRLSSGKMVGAIVVCADCKKHGWPVGLERAMGPLETLAARISGTMENELLTDRLQRTEKLAGLGQLAGGVAHALNNPLTAVLGFAELIAESSTDARVRKDAATIALEALKMKDTVQRLTDFWRPDTASDETVDVMGLLRELGAACAGKLGERGVRLVLTAEDEVPAVLGNRGRLRQVFEHLLNNAAQAIGVAAAQGEDEGDHTIRINVSDDGRILHMIVSDTGHGFSEPAKVFDPFYTTKQREPGAGMGLSICYRIVREHRGEISAFNLHPRGAAVVVELPVNKGARGESGDRVLVAAGGEE